MAKKTLARSSKAQVIKFTLDVKATIQGGTIKGIDFHMNLNPDKRILQIEEQLSTCAGLTLVLDEIKKAIGELDQRTQMYNEAVTIDSKIYSKYFYAGYEQNLKPSFEKIDKIHYTHNSPETSNVSYTKSYNGDKRPTNR
ncbi:MAG: hypothetical protein ABIS36_05715 [Chryseolinea sp.]